MIRVFEAFSGIGTQRMALKRLGVEHTVVGISEIDKFAIKSYEAIHGEAKNFGDILKLNPKDLPDFDLFTYSFPCQDLSLAGKMAGMGKGTRSGLLYESEKIIEAKRPKYLLLENVKGLVGKRFKADFDKWLIYLESLGYTNYWQVLNAKDYGVPQNRERVFVVSILGDHVAYEFPEKVALDKYVADVLETNVDEKFYVNKPFTLTGVNNVFVDSRVLELIDFNGEVAHIKQATKQGYAVCKNNGVADLSYVTSKTRRGRVIDGGDTSPCVTTSPNIYVIGQHVRRLTPLECWRLMGISDDDFYKAKNMGVTDNQLYKQGGERNSGRCAMRYF